MPVSLTKSLSDESAREVLDVIPLVMRGIRNELRKHGARELTVPQFRTLAFLSRRKDPSLSEVAEHIGLTLPSMSALVDGLVSRDLAVRRVHPGDRRRMILELTDRGQTMLRSAREATQAYLAELLRSQSSTDQNTITKAMRILRSVFAEQVP
jgi:DNA-binding MarR family transcriptional regulator